MKNAEVTECPYYLISRASLAVTAWLKRELAAAEVGQIRPGYIGVLMSLWQEDGLKVVELGRRAGLEPSTMTGVLDRMERDGLVVREPDPEDRRAHRISLTEQGRAVEPQVLAVVERTMEEGFDGVSEGDQNRLKDVLRLLLANADRAVKS
jgi:DNA-binding MarR family transcriptional regulator